MNHAGGRARLVALLTAACVGPVILLPAGPAEASAAGLAISVPTSVSFGSFAAGARTISVSLGTVTVTTSSTIGQDTGWTATVSTTAFTTGAGSTAETVPASSVSYRTGTATALSGLTTAVCTPGQVTLVPLSTARTAFSCTGVSTSAGGTSLSWNPQLSIAIVASNVVGTYTGTITHSVA